MERWFWFTACKDGREVRGRIPAKTLAEAARELRRLGYHDITFFDSYPVYNYSNTFCDA